MKLCALCKKEISVQQSGELEIIFIGGYGMAFDGDPEIDDPFEEIRRDRVVCVDCAPEFVERFELK